MKPEFLEQYATSIVPVGSRVTCDPAPMDTDEDWLVLIKEKNYNAVLYELDRHLFTLDRPNTHYRPENNTFNSWRGQEGENLIITSESSFYIKFLAATHVAKNLNIMSKQDRVMLFQAVLYGIRYDPIAKSALYTPFYEIAA